MKKTKKIFSLAVLVLCIAVLGLVSAASAYDEPSVPTILNDRYGAGNWVSDSATDIRFTQTYYLVLIYVDNHSAAFRDSTGWYSTATGDLYQLFWKPKTGDSTTFNPGEEFGLYIKSRDPEWRTYYYSQQSRNPDSKVHAELYRITGGTYQGVYVVAFEDLTDWSGSNEPDYNDVVLEITNVNLVPEFTTIAIPAGMILGLFYFFRRKRQGREE